MKTNLSPLVSKLILNHNRELLPNEKLLHYIMRFCEDNGIFKVTKDTRKNIVKSTGLSRRQYYQAFDELTAKGLITRFRNNRSKTQPIYELHRSLIIVRNHEQPIDLAYKLIKKSCHS